MVYLFGGLCHPGSPLVCGSDTNREGYPESDPSKPADLYEFLDTDPVTW